MNAQPGGLLAGKVVVCTGGGSGIGRATVSAFVAAGAQVAVLELDPAKCGALSDFGDAVVAVPGDATTRQDNESLVAIAIERWGKVDVAVTFVGVFDLYTPLAQIPDDRVDAAFDEVFELNVKSPLLTAGRHSTRCVKPAVRSSSRCRAPASTRAAAGRCTSRRSSRSAVSSSSSPTNWRPTCA